MNAAQMFEYASFDGRSFIKKAFGSSSSAWAAAGLALLYLVYNAFFYLDVFPLVSVFELFWNALVFVTPARLAIALDKRQNPEQYSAEESEVQSRSEMHAVKSEALRRVFGLAGSAQKTAPGTTGRLRSASWLGGLTSTRSDAPPGLGNWDNSCYQNSVLQGLSALRSLTTYLDESKAISGQDSSTTAGSLRQTMSDLNDAANNGKRLWTPAKLKSMSSWQQQDAQEYYSRIMDDLEKETIKALSANAPSEGLKEVREWDRSDTPSQNGNKTQPGQPAAQKTPLDGNLAQRVACLRCGFSEGLSMIPFNCLTVPLGSDYSYDIAQCLDSYTGLEEISGVECPKCTLVQQKTQLENMTKDPPDQSIASTKADTTDALTRTTSLPPELRQMVLARLEAVQQALDDSDFSDATLNKKCQIPKKARVSSTKTRQAVIARAPTSLVVHVNRSLFDENTGAMRKNMAQVKYPKVLDLGPWCLGTKSTQQPSMEEWRMDPAKSLITGGRWSKTSQEFQYILRAAVCHYGRHENGHYICYREHPELGDEAIEGSGKMRWWRLSDDEVSSVTEDHVLEQGGVFMLFYERTDAPLTPVKAVIEQATRESAPAVTEVINGMDSARPEEPAALAVEEVNSLADSQRPAAEPATASITQPAIESEPGIPHVSPSEPQPPLEISLEAQQTLSDLKKIPTPPTMRTARRGSKKNQGGFEAPFRVVAAT